MTSLIPRIFNKLYTEELVNSSHINSNFGYELNIEDIIALLNSFGETSLDNLYRIDTDIKINLWDIVKNMSYKEQQYYAKDILYAIRYLLPGRIRNIWQEFDV